MLCPTCGKGRLIAKIELHAEVTLALGGNDTLHTASVQTAVANSHLSHGGISRIRLECDGCGDIHEGNWLGDGWGFLTISIAEPNRRDA